jgi:hypothetical protein
MIWLSHFTRWGCLGSPVFALAALSRAHRLLSSTSQRRRLVLSYPHPASLFGSAITALDEFRNSSNAY